ncbi:PepSY domain-containing protein [Curtobacterium sp. VKM Ac-1393]|uniref:PepSY domain-containing protein n=1 Tax=Curtobacterium sp. VKM Ac-1393 TaxID=2783814 RepID=UPI00188D2155|nr:PepSY domain-containing protein [Curtobacterium sp. VKM Ac-1393]MBF4608610.1 PepSY domain-containing protein [Curtobacterium sp. VKM Ac-1393]
MNLRTQHQKSSARRVAALAALPVVAALALAGCSTAGSSTGSSAIGATTGTTGTTATAASAASNEALLAAVATAWKSVGSGTVISVEQEQRGSAYEVLVVTEDGTEHEVHTDAAGTGVTGTPQTETADTDDRAEHDRFVAAADLDVRTAVSAFEDLHAGSISELGLDDHLGTVVWEGDVVDGSGTKHSVRIDAGSGDVVTDQVDTDD